MRTIYVLLASGVFLLAGCRASRSRVAPAPQSPPLAATTAPTASGPTASRPTTSGPKRLRYYDLKDLDTRNGILMVRGTTEQLGAIDQHLSAIRSILRDAESGEAALQSRPQQGPIDTRTVQIHVVGDLVKNLAEARGDANPQQTILTTIREGLGTEAWNKSVIRFQGESALVVKTLPETQERVAAILEGLRGDAR